MQLVRLDSNPHLKDDELPQHHREESYHFEKADDFPTDEVSKVKALFLRFGKGQERRSSFQVEISWIDFKGLFRTFVDMGHPDAIHLERLLKAVHAIENMGWQNDAEPIDFWEDLHPE